MSEAADDHRDDDLPEIFAFVIGINKYQSDDFDDLRGAVGDADRFEDYLTKALNVPRSNIISLRDERATRKAIIAGFNSLRDDTRFKKDEAAIIIYFAGHGARDTKPQDWTDWETAGMEIEILCPADAGLRTNPDSSDEEDVIPGIPDRVISSLLDELSRDKGDNITLILDCCHAEGINRANHSRPGYRARELYNPPPYHPRWDRGIVRSERRSAGTANGFSGKHEASHVLLAACGRHQKALESDDGYGMFTDGLLKVLGSFRANDLTYTALMHRLNMPPWQTPHCKGHHINRRLFNKRAQGTDGSFMLCKREKITDPPGMRLTLRAGAAQGVTERSVYGVYQSNLVSDTNHSNPCLGKLVVTSVDAFSSTLSTTPDSTFEFPPGRTFYSKLVERASGELSVHCSDKQWIETVFPPDIKKALSIILVDDPEAAELCVSITDGELRLDRNNPLISPHIGTRLPFKMKQRDTDAIPRLREIARCLSHFNHHLTRTGRDLKNVWMELKVVEVDEDTDIRTTVNSNLFQTSPAKVVVDEDAELHMNIFNKTMLPLYPYLFYFDPSYLAIVEWYTSPLSGGAGAAVNAPLPPNSQLTLGHGEAGVPPWYFSLAEGENKDIGFFKLFLTTKPADFSNIVQESPFELLTTRHGGPGVPNLPEADIWSSKLATVIQLRYPEAL